MAHLSEQSFRKAMETGDVKKRVKAFMAEPNEKIRNDLLGDLYRALHDDMQASSISESYFNDALTDVLLDLTKGKIPTDRLVPALFQALSTVCAQAPRQVTNDNKH